MKKVFVCNTAENEIFNSKEELLQAVKLDDDSEIYQIDLHPTEKVVWEYCHGTFRDYVGVRKIDPPKIISTFTEVLR